MKRYLCPSHGHLLKTKPVGLSTELCSVCRWENRTWTLTDFASQLEDIAQSLRFADERPDYDPHGITYARDITSFIKTWLKTIHPDYRKGLLEEINK